MLLKVMAMKFMQRDLRTAPESTGKVKLVDPLMWACPDAPALLAAARPPTQRVGYTEIRQLVSAPSASEEAEPATLKKEDKPLSLDDLIGGKKKRKSDGSKKKSKKQKTN